MSLAQAEPAEYERGIWKLIAFLARYAHQPIDQSLKLTRREMFMLCEEVSEMVKEENAASS